MFVYIVNICLHYMGWGNVQIATNKKTKKQKKQLEKKIIKKQQMIYVDVHFVFCSISL